ncbi:MAG: GGDEF domain-containing protein, partial [Bacilli bacterium]|jgi:diguanylate cyclase (GGDEF)-like protein
MILFPVLLLIRKRRELPHRRVSSLISFALLPLAGIIVQALFYGFSVTVNFLVFALLIAYLFIQSETMDTDFLTGIGNRRKFEVSLNSLVMANKPFSAILLDLDNFKQINDRHGHGAGDLALKKTADILRASVREGDTIARYGGDEFCIITGIDNHAALRECVQRIRDNFQKHNENPETEIHLELSIGYLVYEPGKVSASEFLKKLDQRMYRDKFQRKKSVL